MAATAVLTVLARQNEPIDALVWRTLGRTRDAVEATIAANPGLGAHILALPAGHPVRVPIDAGATASPRLVELWGPPPAAAAPAAPLNPAPAPEDYVPAYHFIAADPLLVWIIDHNLGHRPVISVRDASGAEIGADIVHESLNRTVVTFTAPTAGTARLV